MKADTLSKVKKLLDYYETGKIPRLTEHEVNPGFEKGSRENYLYFTLPVCINFQRSSPAMWASALATWNDEETRFLFYPEQLASKSFEEAQKALGKHRLGLQPNKHTLIWTTIARTLNEHFENDPRAIVTLAEDKITNLLNILQVSHKQHFPYLSGPKLSNYWPYILSQYSDVEWTDPWEISIIPDTHIIKSTAHLGLTSEIANSDEVAAVWKELLKNSGINPVQVHPVLWNWSRNNFLPKV